MAQEVVSTQLFGEHLAHNPQNLVPPPLGDCCCLISGLSQPKAQVVARALENFCHVTAAFLPGTKLRRWPDQPVLDEPLLQCLVYTCFMFSIRGFVLENK